MKQKWGNSMKNSNNTAVVALFVRAPIPGRVKTRLASDLGAEGACSLYHAMVTDILDAIRTCGLTMYLFYDGEDVHDLPKAWVTASDKMIAQKGDSIGEKMGAAFEYCFMENLRQVILMGSDIPGLNFNVLTDASQALKRYDAVIAPTLDGGYCLIALKQERYRPELFHNIPWSTDQVLRSTFKIIEECNLDACLMEKLQDIDTIDDLRDYYRHPAENACATNRAILNLIAEF